MHNGREIDCPTGCKTAHPYGFSEKFFAFFGVEMADVEAGGAFETGVAYDLLFWINEEVVGDIQHVESKNSVLRAMSSRARHMRWNLMSSRHTIKCSDPELVTKASLYDNNQ